MQKPILIYGKPNSGKTYTAKQLAMPFKSVEISHVDLLNNKHTIIRSNTTAIIVDEVNQLQDILKISDLANKKFFNVYWPRIQPFKIETLLFIITTQILPTCKTYSQLSKKFNLIHSNYKPVSDDSLPF